MIPEPPGRWAGERGSASVLAVGLIAVTLVVTVAALTVLGAVRAAHVARSTADLSALAGAGEYQQSVIADTACAEAGRIAVRHGARLLDCAVGVAGDVTVTVGVGIPLRLGGVVPEQAEGRARAGPAE